MFTNLHNLILQLEQKGNNATFLNSEMTTEISFDLQLFTHSKMLQFRKVTDSKMFLTQNSWVQNNWNIPLKSLLWCLYDMLFFFLFGAWQMYSAYKKVFIPFHFFHVLLCCSLMLNCFKLLFFHINLHSIHHNDKAKTELPQLRKLIKNKKTEISTLHKSSYP